MFLNHYIIVFNFSATFFFSFEGGLLLFFDVTLLFSLVEGHAPDYHAALLSDGRLWLHLVSHWSARSRLVPDWLYKLVSLRIQLQL